MSSGFKNICQIIVGAQGSFPESGDMMSERAEIMRRILYDISSCQSGAWSLD